ncbi:cation efflux protein [Basidiobolus meristosporus CBS 931.73]|uniref:magnesium chelatase n=1 Tax=Basidiobolus meristosporus CBS 931.73 TaxID=1314790 RepID=A0A1Y1YSC4_9FUNG|nr:cation efflux protein [Basidiobolus meristosporus CBS 931.73]|eukprot:ORY00921.1 cation efflux protein [Basidiobolus meristosporus CBS 931.73]
MINRSREKKLRTHISTVARANTPSTSTMPQSGGLGNTKASPTTLKYNPSREFVQFSNFPERNFLTEERTSEDESAHRSPHRHSANLERFTDQSAIDKYTKDFGGISYGGTLERNSPVSSRDYYSRASKQQKDIEIIPLQHINGRKEQEPIRQQKSPSALYASRVINSKKLANVIILEGLENASNAIQLALSQEVKEIALRVKNVVISPEISRYLRDLMVGIRLNPKFRLGASPHASMDLFSVLRALAAIYEKAYVTPELVLVVINKTFIINCISVIRLITATFFERVSGPPRYELGLGDHISIVRHINGHSDPFHEPLEIDAEIREDAVSSDAAAYSYLRLVPRRVHWYIYIVGGTISAFIGVSVGKIFEAACEHSTDHLWLQASLAVSLAIVGMMLTRSVHPPGAATALITVTSGQSIRDIGYFFLVSPLLLGTAIMIIVAVLFNNVHRKYPKYWIFRKPELIELGVNKRDGLGAKQTANQDVEIPMIEQSTPTTEAKLGAAEKRIRELEAKIAKMEQFAQLGLSERRDYSAQYTYGWQRAEVLGALINGVFLVALCFSIFLEAIQRFFEPQDLAMLLSDVKNPELVLIVGGFGLVVNILGLSLFHEHTDDAPENNPTFSSASTSLIETADRVKRRRESITSVDETTPILNPAIGGEGRRNDGKLNMHSIFLHVLGDTLGSVAVIVSSAVIWKCDFPYKYVLDPIIRYEPSARGVPSSIPVDLIHEQISNMRYVRSVHELHIWQLTDTKVVASVHICVEDADQYNILAEKINELLSSYGVHSVTIQPEFLNIDQGRPFKCPAVNGISTCCPPNGTN